MLHVGVVLNEDPLERIDRLSRALEACRKSPGGPGFQLHVRDHSFSALKRSVAERLPDSLYFHSPTRPGLAAGHNAMMLEAFAQGATDYVALHSDAVPHPDCLRALVAEKGRHSRAGLVEARQFPDEHPKPYDPATHLTPWASRGMLLVTAELHQAIGGFDEHLSSHCEDVDYSWRARGAGFALALAPDALVHHRVEDLGPADLEKQLAWSGAYLARKYADRRFEQRCARRYQQLTGQRVELPVPPVPGKDALRAADFGHGFAFAERRW